MSRIIELLRRNTKRSEIDYSQLPEIHSNVRQIRWGDKGSGNYETLIVDTTYQVFAGGKLHKLPLIEYNRKHEYEPVHLEAYSKNLDGTYTLATHTRSKGSDAGTGTYFDYMMTIPSTDAMRRIRGHMQRYEDSAQKIPNIF